MANQDSELNVRNTLIYVGYFSYGFDMVQLGKAFGIKKQRVSKILDEISVKQPKADLEKKD